MIHRNEERGQTVASDLVLSLLKKYKDEYMVQFNASFIGKKT